VPKIANQVAAVGQVMGLDSVESDVTNINPWVLHPVARVSLKFTKVQVPPYTTSVFVSLFITLFTLHVSALFIGHLHV
jgi:hypothetical protein